MPTSRRDRLRSERGAELLEFALVFPLLLLMFAGIADMGLVFKDYQVMTNAAREGARLAALPGTTESDVTTRVNNYLAAGALMGTATTTLENVALPGADGPINCVRVTVEVPHQYLVLGGISKLLQADAIANPTLRAVVTMRVEAVAGL